MIYKYICFINFCVLNTNVFAKSKDKVEVKDCAKWRDIPSICGKTFSKGQLILKCFFVSSILPKNKRKQFDLRYLSSKLKFIHSFFGTIEETINLFRDLLTFTCPLDFQTFLRPCRLWWWKFELSIAPMNNYGHALKLFQCSATIAVWSGQFYQVIMYTRGGDLHPKSLYGSRAGRCLQWSNTQLIVNKPIFKQKEV